MANNQPQRYVPGQQVVHQQSLAASSGSNLSNPASTPAGGNMSNVASFQ